MRDDGLYAKKLERLRRAMSKHALDAIILAKNDNTRYLTGYQRYYCASYLPFVHAVFVSHQDGPILLLPDHIAPYGERCFAQEVLEFPISRNHQLEVLRHLARRLGVASGRIGVETDFMQAEYFEALRAGLDGAHLVSATRCMAEVLAVKFPEEIALLRRAATLVDIGVGAIIDAAREGMTEKHLAAAGAAALADGAEFFNHLCVRTGENALLLSPVNTDRVIRRGDPIQLDIGYICDGYVSDINRTLILGGPTVQQAEVLTTIVRVQREVIRAMRPGIRASDLYGLTRKLIADAGYLEHFRMPFVGHSIGVSLHEDPYVKADEPMLLEAGMVLAIEPGLYIPGQGTCRMEDMIVITENGREFLTHYPDDLTINGVT